MTSQQVEGEACAGKGWAAYFWGREKRRRRSNNPPPLLPSHPSKQKRNLTPLRPDGERQGSHRLVRSVRDFPLSRAFSARLGPGVRGGRHGSLVYGAAEEGHRHPFQHPGVRCFFVIRSASVEFGVAGEIFLSERGRGRRAGHAEEGPGQGRAVGRGGRGGGGGADEAAPTPAPCFRCSARCRAPAPLLPSPLPLPLPHARATSPLRVPTNSEQTPHSPRYLRRMPIVVVSSF